MLARATVYFLARDSRRTPTYTPPLASTQTGVSENDITNAAPIRLLRPYIAADIVTRPRLLRLLEHGASLTLVVAPAGYGKTTLIADWLETCDLPAAWLTFDAEVTDFHHFLTHLLTVMRAAVPDCCSDIVQELLAARTLPSPDVIADMLHTAFAALDQEVVLVLDDYHTVAAPEAHSLLAELLRLPPTPLRIVLAARHDPPLPLMKLRAYGKLVEIRSQDLSFTVAEAAQFLTDSLTAPLDEREFGDLVRGMEGWAASLRLAQLYLRREQGYASLARALEIGARHAREFLAEEVFSGLPPAIQEFLMRTAILERLSARVCAALSADGDPATAEANLRWLAANGVFTVPIDDAGGWFHRHALLRQLALQQLHMRYSDAEVATLHRRASQWFAGEGNTEAAIRHALAAGDVTLAVDTLAQARPALMDAARWLEIAHLLQYFPSHQIASEPELLLTQAWFARSQNNVRLLQATLQLLLNLLNTPAGSPSTSPSPETARVRGEVEALLASLCFWRADMKGVGDHAMRALVLLPGEARFARGFTVLFCVCGQWATVSRAAAWAILEEYARNVNPDDPIEKMYILTSAASLHALAADLPSLATTTDEMLEIGAGQPWTEPLGVAHYNRLAAHYYRNELSEVEGLASKMLAHRYQASPRYIVQAVCFLALAYQAQGRTVDADAVAAAELAFIEAAGVMEMLPYVHALRADLALRQGSVEAAAALLREAAQAPLLPTATHYIPHLAVLRLYLHQRTPASLDMAEALLERLEHFWSEFGHAHILLELAVQKSLYWQARGQETVALETLAQAARLAEPMGCIRIFADCGLQLDGLLAKLQQTGVTPLLVVAVRAAIASEASDVQPSLASPSRAATSSLATPPNDDLSILLTFREQEVLQLLGAHLTNQEIAARLCISPQTVKRHLIGIFRKLDVKNRRAAASYARQLPPA
jgi:LuxR family maltose regulon positive regulatory protein